MVHAEACPAAFVGARVAVRRVGSGPPSDQGDGRRTKRNLYVDDSLGYEPPRPVAAEPAPAGLLQPSTSQGEPPTIPARRLISTLGRIPLFPRAAASPSSPSYIRAGRHLWAGPAPKGPAPGHRQTGSSGCRGRLPPRISSRPPDRLLRPRW